MKAKKRTVVLGVTGSIAAYKAADLCSKLVQNGFDVVVIMTRAAQELVTARTFLTLSRNPVVVDLWSIPDWQPGHVELADHAALLVVAPCTANMIGKMANGIADDALSTYALSHEGPILLAPAMNPKMWRNPAVRDNCRILEKRGVRFAGPAKGRVACGDDGEGRMVEVPQLVEIIDEYSRRRGTKTT
jgi:phosphopantothenoylcysteine synthetase/decarboxylase